MTTRLRALRDAGFVCNGAIDGGAAFGSWTREFWSVFPTIPVLMVEPQSTFQAMLRELARNVPSSEVIAAALSCKPGMVSFILQGANSRICEIPASDERMINLPCITLASILAGRPGFSPNLLKMDLQGHELQAMKGAGDRLQHFEVIISEMSVIPIGGVPAFAEMNRFFEDQGFQFYDVLPQFHRPLDGALWQVDAFYVRRDSALIASTSWS